MADTTLELEAFATGTYHGRKFTVAHLDEMVANFERLRHAIKPPLKLGHDNAQLLAGQEDGDPALGWVTGLKRVGQKLIASVAGIPQSLATLITSGRYARVSSEIYPMFEQTEAEKNLATGASGHVLSAIALLGADVPAVKTLADLAAFLGITGDHGLVTCTAAPDTLVCTPRRKRADHTTYAPGSMLDFNEAVAEALSMAMPMMNWTIRDLFPDRVIVECDGCLYQYPIAMAGDVVALGAAVAVAVQYQPMPSMEQPPMDAVPPAGAPAPPMTDTENLLSHADCPPTGMKESLPMEPTPTQLAELEAKVMTLGESNAAKDAELARLSEKVAQAEAREAAAAARALESEAQQYVATHSADKSLRLFPAQRTPAQALYVVLAGLDTKIVCADKTTTTALALFQQMIEAYPSHHTLLSEVTRATTPAPTDAEAWMADRAKGLNKDIADAKVRGEMTRLLFKERPDLAPTYGPHAVN